MTLGYSASSEGRSRRGCVAAASGGLAAWGWLRAVALSLAARSCGRRDSKGLACCGGFPAPGSEVGHDGEADIQVGAALRGAGMGGRCTAGHWGAGAAAPTLGAILKRPAFSAGGRGGVVATRLTLANPFDTDVALRPVGSPVKARAGPLGCSRAGPPRAVVPLPPATRPRAAGCLECWLGLASSAGVAGGGGGGGDARLMAFSRAARSCGSRPSLPAAGVGCCVAQLGPASPAPGWGCCVAQFGSAFVEKGLWSGPRLLKPANAAPPPCLSLPAATEYGRVECPRVDNGVDESESKLDVGNLPSGFDVGRSEGRVQGP